MKFTESTRTFIVQVKNINKAKANLTTVKNTFINIFVTALVLFIIVGGACKKESLSEIRQTTFNTLFDLQLSERILVKSPQRQLMVELRSLNDNRCTTWPCEHAGNATTRVFISDTDGHAEAETNLCIGTCNTQIKTRDTVSVIMAETKYILILTNVSGSPDKKAELQINID